MHVWLLITTTVETVCYAEGPIARTYAHRTREGAIERLREFMTGLPGAEYSAGEAVAAVRQDGWWENDVDGTLISVEVKSVEVGQ